MPEPPNKGGRKPRVTDEDLLNVFRSTTDPVLSTAEVAEQVPIKRRGVLRRLRTLEESGELESKQIGGRNTVWWLSGSQEGHSSPVNEPEPIPDESPVRTQETQETQETTKETQEIDALDELEFPSGKDQSECKATIRAARDYLENAPASKKDIVSEIMPQYPLGYDSEAALSKIEAGDRYRGAWWRRIVKPGLEALDDVQKPARGQSEWRVTNEQR